MWKNPAINKPLSPTFIPQISVYSWKPVQNEWCVFIYIFYLPLVKQVIINLVDQAGREKIIGDAFLKQVLLYNNPSLTYVSFDFHEHW